MARVGGGSVKGAMEEQIGPASRWLQEARALQTRLVEWRRHLHRIPELAFQERETSAYLAAQLQEMGLSPRRVGEAGGTGLLCDIAGADAGAGSGPTVLLRAEMDGLPVEERTGLPFASVHPGLMHACGHDGHMAMLLGAAALLTVHRRELPGRVRLLFQPAEEMRGGAREMIAAGVLAGVDVAFAQHLWPGLPVGTVAFKRGVAMAAMDRVHIRVIGRAGHGGAPHLATDAVVAQAHVVLALQSLISRRINPATPAVLTLGTVHGGKQENVIAEEVDLTGTVRTVDPACRQSLPKMIEEAVASAAAGVGARAETTWEWGYPPLVNDEQALNALARAISGGRGMSGIEVRWLDTPAFASEDFAFYLERVPGVFAFLGAGKDAAAVLHSPTLNVDEAVLPVGAATLVVAAFELLVLARERRVGQTAGVGLPASNIPLESACLGRRVGSEGR